jgi:hypothetical protein
LGAGGVRGVKGAPWLFLLRSLLFSVESVLGAFVVAELEVAFCTGRSDGPGAETPAGVLTVVNGLNVTVLCGRGGIRDAVAGLEGWY